MKINKQLDTLEEKLRYLVNLPRRQGSLIADDEVWNRLCASMDVIEDTSLCMKEYLDKKIDERCFGYSYLIIYGILQSLFLQQDAIIHIADVLKVPVALPKELKEIREIRNDSIGHPVRSQKGKITAINYLVRPGISPYGFQIMTWYPNIVEPFYKSIKIPELVKTQERVVEDIMNNIIRKMEDEDMKHKKKFKDEKLVDCFGGNYRYYIGKLYEIISGYKGSEYALMHVEIVRDIIKNIKDKLVERDELGNRDFLDYAIEQLDYPIKRLTEYYSDGQITDDDAYIYTYFIDKKMNELKSLLEEIDREYDDIES